MKILNDPLLAIAKVMLIFVMGVLAIAVVAITIGIPFILFGNEMIFAELAPKVPIEPTQHAFNMIALIAALALAAIVALFYFFLQMKNIVGSVGDGDPFIPLNAKRLTLMAWLMLGVEILTIPMAALAIYVTNLLGEDATAVDAGLDFSSIILIVILFILARVFRQGAAMRDDLEGTV